MQEKIIDEMKHWGEDDTLFNLNENIDTYERFKWEIEGIVNYPEDFTKEDILAKLKEELERLEKELR